MAKKSAVEKNQHRRELVARFKARRQALRAVIMDKAREPEERFDAVLRLAQLPRNSSKTRVRNRCGMTGRPRGYYRKFGLSRIALRDLAAQGQVPGVVKASW